MKTTSGILPPAVVELDQEDDDAWGAPPGPLCSVCEHPLCPMCPEPWCDRLIECEGDEDGSLDSCCDTSCTVDALEFADWKQRAVAIMLGRDHHCDTPIEEHTCWTHELGPYCPTWQRTVRACMMCRARLEDDAPRASYLARGASGLEWFECPDHEPLDNLAEDRRVSRELLCDWLPKVLRGIRGVDVGGIALGSDDPLVNVLWGIPPEGEN